MKAILVQLDHSSEKPLYIQLYNYLKTHIVSGDIAPDEKLPSLRNLSKTLGISMTTSKLAYDQLLVEGYIYSKPQSGYYAENIISTDLSPTSGKQPAKAAPEKAESREAALQADFAEEELLTDKEDKYMHDLSSFNFARWKKCVSQIISYYPEALLSGADKQGEMALRVEIARYVYTSRGVSCTPDQVVIGAGTQPLMSHLSLLLRKIGIDHMSTEYPGYAPLQKIFSDFGFPITKIPVREDGIEIEKLPSNIRSAVYVSPSNQFPTGSVMPVDRRYRLLSWAKENGSVIIEDDYNSELRYFGNPVPALDSLDTSGSVVYLGSFSSTLFAAVRISYMILPDKLMKLFDELKNDYDQTCSKTEQLTLALFMKNGDYARNIRKLRTLYAKKLAIAAETLRKFSDGRIKPLNTKSGINITIEIKTKLSPDLLCKSAAERKVQMIPVKELSGGDTVVLTLYYNQIPEDKMESVLVSVMSDWRDLAAKSN
ncbi:MAG: PLP-dependent aminotransferase family protein [Eubacteriales bacterium]|nr:PLP-dependent aminotransferase family protein [Eubacteriales bacterium]